MAEAPDLAAAVNALEHFIEEESRHGVPSTARIRARLALALLVQAVQAAGCGCKTDEQAGTRNGYMCPWHRDRYLQAVQAAEKETT